MLPCDLATGLVKVDGEGRPLPAVLARIHAAVSEAVAGGEYRVATALSDLLFTVTPRPQLTLQECCPQTPEAKLPQGLGDR